MSATIGSAAPARNNRQYVYFLRMSQKATVIYNGSCPICAREIAHYAARSDACDADLQFLDLTKEDPSRFGITRDEAARRLYVVENGALLSGISAFRTIWARLPGWRWLARIAALPGLSAMFSFLYESIAAPLLYRLHLRRERQRV